MRAVIIGNGEICDYTYIKSQLCPDDFIICADGGLRHLDGLEVSADIAIGDFDSGEERGDVKTCVYPTEKAQTDGELAVDYAIDNGYTEILMLGMTGTRLDHTMTNMFQLIKGEGITILDEKNEIRLLKNKLRIEGQRGKTLSVIPIYQNLTGVTTRGVYYPLTDETLYFGQGRGNSNVITEDVCEICAKGGLGLVFINNGE